MNQSIHLLIDTSTDLLVLGLFTGQAESIAVRSLAHANNLSKTLLPSVQSLLEAQGLTPQDLSGIACGIGPGSYTGTRVGSAVAKSLGFALQIPVQGFSSLLSFIPPSVSGAFSFLVSTRSGNVFVLQGDFSSGHLRVAPHRFVELSDLSPLIHSTTCISRTPEAFPFPCLPPQLNLPALIPFLFTSPSSRDTDLDLLYLHPGNLKN